LPYLSLRVSINFFSKQGRDLRLPVASILVLLHTSSLSFQMFTSQSANWVLTISL